ncbi:MAG TPA: HDIG domain-containing protein [bacterium]|nr:HDIG domain-containing protein [bacterium]
MTREEALKLLDEWVPNKNLQKHMFAVEAAVLAYARKFGQDEEKWGLAALLHDADYEKWPEEHPQKIVKKLQSLKVESEISDAIASHGGKGAIPRKTKLDHTLFACDELTGLIVATALMYPGKLADVTVERVMKKYKNAGFARGVNREEVAKGAEELGVELQDHVALVLAAMQASAGELGL